MHFPLPYLTGDTTVYLFTDAQSVYFLQSTIPRVTCLRLSDASIICRVAYFLFPIQSAFLPCRRPGNCSGYMVYPLSDIGKCVPCTEHTAQGTDFELILSVQVATRHPVGASVGTVFFGDL